jgi:hypothetical protein
VVEVQVASPGLAHQLEVELKDEEILELRDRLRDFDAMLTQERRESAEMAAEVAKEVRARVETVHQQLRGPLARAEEELKKEQNARQQLEQELTAEQAKVKAGLVRVPGLGDAELSALKTAVRAESSRRQRLLFEEEVRREMRAEQEQERQAAAPSYAP